jgi:orotidine-5'-phosphate decarboxylase
VRSPGASKGDQKRVATPAEAISDGADYLVMGRQITRAENPAAEVARVLEEIEAVRPGTRHA